MCCSYTLRVCGCVFCLFLFCLYICVCVYLQIQGPLRECRSIRPGTSGLPHYCAPLVCVPAVLGLLAVWWDNKLKPKNLDGVILFKNKHSTTQKKEWAELNWRIFGFYRKGNKNKKTTRRRQGKPSGRVLPGFPMTVHHLWPLLM